MKIWEKKTEGEGTEDVSPDAAKGTRKGGNVATWTKEEGYEGKEHRDINEVLEEYDDRENFWKAHYSGRKEVKNSSAGPMRDYYNLINSALFNPELPGGRKAKLKRRKALVLRVLFFKVVRKKFAETYAKQIGKAYSELGQEVPPFATMGRGEAIRTVREFKANGGDANLLQLFERGLVKLNPDLIPQNWI